MDATLGVVQRFVAGARDGWELAIDALEQRPRALRRAPARPRRGHRRDAHRARLRRHRPRFAPEEPCDESLSLLTATIDEEIEQLFLELPARGRWRRSRGAARRPATACSCSPTSASAAGSSATTATCTSARRCCARRAAGSSSTSRASRRARCSSAGASARRCATSPGCCARSPTPPSASDLQHGRPAPDGWEERAREAFLERLLRRRSSPADAAGQAATDTLLSVFELEKAVYELRYELNNRPDWVAHPGRGHRPPARGADRA